MQDVEAIDDSGGGSGARLEETLCVCGGGALRNKASRYERTISGDWRGTTLGESTN
jgi:hypothetical protein